MATVIAGRDALPRLETVILGDDHDAYINGWADWWTQKALTDPQLSLWKSDYLSTTAGILAGIIFAFNSHNVYQSALNQAALVGSNRAALEADASSERFGVVWPGGGAGPDLCPKLSAQ